MSKKRGLFLGRFSILHKGHQYVIDTALQEVDELIVLVYNSPDTTNTPLSVRASWIRTLYPNVKVLEGWNSPEETGYTEEIKRIHEQYVMKMVEGIRITHFYSSEWYGEPMSKELKCINRLVDTERSVVKVSATKIQESVYKYKDYISPVVYKDLITNIVFLGAQSTGKSTIAEELAQEYQTNFMPEYGRKYWETHQINGKLSIAQLVEVAQGHLEMEDQLLECSNKYLFTVTNAISTFLLSEEYHDKASRQLIDLAKMAENRYDIVFLCADDFPYNAGDGIGNMKRKVFQRKIIADLLVRKIPYIELRGTLQERMGKVKSVLSNFEKYTSLGKNL